MSGKYVEYIDDLVNDDDIHLYSEGDKQVRRSLLSLKIARMMSASGCSRPTAWRYMRSALRGRGYYGSGNHGGARR